MHDEGKLYIPKITNGSIVTIGRDGGNIKFVVDHHFNWFQKKMIKWCFGIDVEDYSEKETYVI